jgi:hypothetical protein
MNGASRIVIAIPRSQMHVSSVQVSCFVIHSYEDDCYLLISPAVCLIYVRGDEASPASFFSTACFQLMMGSNVRPAQSINTDCKELNYGRFQRVFILVESSLASNAEV